MKKIIIIGLFIISSVGFSQEHFAGLTTSSRGGLLSSAMNPAEFANATKKIEVNLYGFSINASNNKIGFEDIISGKNLEKILFAPGEAVNARLDAEIYGPSVGLKIGKWGFGVSTKANGKLNVVNVDANLGDALINDVISSGLSTTINYPNNQRVVGTTWGEVGLSLARTILDSENNKFSVGATMKLMFPGSYSNVGLSAFKGTITKVGNDLYLNNATAGLNISYSGNLANSFTDFSDYSKSVFGGFNGFVGDIGVSYQRKDKSILDVVKSKNKYKLSIGASIKNIGSMTFKDDNNYNTNYQLDIRQNLSDSNPNNDNPLGFNLAEIQNIDKLGDIESTLTRKGYLVNSQDKTDFVVKLPTTFVAYADLKLVSKLYISGFIQQKLSDDANNDQITAQNYITVTPRINLGFFEAYVPLSDSEISGFNAGFGFRLGGFYLGSGSAITSLLDQKNSKQADFYTGFRWGFL
ncbi:hypothetical protein [Flavobacterium sp.]|jgi:hypothetical protein|uniref:hypothetical protein n=1 Tax=Flavobacterium sp. TaxID=239 RepID=UPI0037C0E141